MDFELHYTQEQEKFRKEVRAWLDANIPREVELPEDPDDIEPGSDLYRWILECRRKLGEKGWWAPTLPKEYGGGGLSVDKAIILDEELAERSWSSFTTGDNGSLSVGALGAACVLAYGTEEQKRRLVPPMCRGEITVWQGYTEPEAGSDLASLKTTAIRDGDVYVMNGEKVFGGTKYPVNYMHVLAITDPKAPRHRNIGVFLVPMDLPGITIEFLPILSYGVPGKRHVYFDNVRVPAFYLIGGDARETDGWLMANAQLEGEHGGGGSVVRPERSLGKVVAYCKEAQRNGQPLSQDPAVRQALVEVYILNEMERLINLRNYWMHSSKKRGVGYEASQGGLIRKTTIQKVAALYNDALGPAVLIKEPEWAILKGALEFQQQLSMSDLTGMGTIEIHRLIMARRMGISRTKETAPEML